MASPTITMAMPAASAGPPPNPVFRNARYSYLVTRLRMRQITMEEATELFEILQGALARAVTATAPAPAPAAPPPPTPRAPSESRLPALADETLGLSLIAMGAGAGLLAAILKRGQEGPERKTP